MDGLSCNPLDRRIFASGSHDHTIRIWDANTAKEVQCWKENNEGIWNLQYHPKGNQIASVSPEGVAKFWDPKNGKVTGTLKGHSSKIYWCRYNNDGTNLITCGSGNEVFIWDTRKVMKHLMELKGHGMGVRSCDYLANDKFAVSCDFDSEVIVWDIQQSKLMANIKFPEGPNGVEAGNMGLSVRGWKGIKNELAFLVGHEDSLIRDIRAQPGQMTVVGQYEGHSNGVRFIGANANESKLLTGCEDHSFRIWDVATHEPKFIMAGHTDFGTCGDFISDNLVVTGSWDQRVSIWKIPA